jgi:tetratricopeptide (TPR) repeat protein
VSSHAAADPRPPAGWPAVAWRRPAELLARVRPDTVVTVALGLLLAAVALGAGGGLQLGPTTRVEVGLEAAGGLLGAAAILAGGRRRMHGGLALALFGVLAALTAVSVLWSVQPDDTWLEANRTLSYLAAFGGGIALVRLAPERWSGVLGATLLACTIVSVYALTTKVFPGALAPDETYARLREPFGYWNAVGLMAALGIPGCLWLGARRSGHSALNALAYPACGVLLVAILLAYSRGSLLAAVIGCGFWFAVVPLRLRGVAVLAPSALGAVLVTTWAFSQDALSKDNVLLDLRTTTGHELGVALVAMVLALGAAGLAVGFLTARRAPGPQVRRQAGVWILLVLALVPLGLAVGLAFSERGLGGSISKGWTELTDPNARTPANDPGRLTAVGSVRSRYFNEALKIGKARPVLGAGAGGYATARPRFRNDDLDVRHAHGYAFQTFADLGILGLAVNFALLLAWWRPARRATGLGRGWRTRPFGPERVGLLTLTAIVVVFGVHSFVDWTWFVPGTAVLALLCAGWLAGRGPQHDALAAAEPPRRRLRERLRTGARDRPRLALAGALLAMAAVAAWATVQPERAVNAGDDALQLASDHHYDAALAAIADARSADPLSVEPLFDLAVVEGLKGRQDLARQALERAVRLQPQNPTPWLRLADFELNSAGRPQRALQVLGPALYLDPRSPLGINLFLEASRRAAGGAAAGAP